MSEPFLSQIMMVGFDFPPTGFGQCDGQVMPINQNQSLYALLGTMYGGDGRTTFALPDLRGRTPIHLDDREGYAQGKAGGLESVTLNESELPVHSHRYMAHNGAGNTEANTGSVLAHFDGFMEYGEADSLVPMNEESVGKTGEGMAHSNMQPYLAIQFVIALRGLFPSRG